MRNIILPLVLLCLIAGCAPAPVGQEAAAATPIVITDAIPTATLRLPSPTAQVTLTLVPTLTLAPSLTPDALACLKEDGRMEQVELESSVLNKPVAVRVYLPPCFDAQREQAYPLLVLLHGQSFKDDQWDRLGADEAAQRMIAAQKSQPFIIAMPEEAYYLQEISQSKFGGMITDELLPYLAGNYHACTSRACTAIGGISRGAIWAYRLGATHPELFGAVGGHSLPGGVTETVIYLRKMAVEKRPRLYLDSGGMDRYLKEAVAYEQVLTRYGIAHEWHLNSGAHDETYWQAHTAEYMAWYCELWGP